MKMYVLAIFEWLCTILALLNENKGQRVTRDRLYRKFRCSLGKWSDIHTLEQRLVTIKRRSVVCVDSLSKRMKMDKQDEPGDIDPPRTTRYHSTKRDDVLVEKSLLLLADHFLLLCAYLEILMAKEETKRSPIFQKFSLAATQG